MIKVGNTILSDDVATARFACDISRCGDACCVDGAARCAIQQAWQEGRFGWEKPIICHLFPVRRYGREWYRDFQAACRERRESESKGSAA